MDKGILWKTKCYSIGSMEYKNGEEWRKILQEKFDRMEVRVLDPYNKQFIQKIDENEEKRKLLYTLRAEKKYKELAAHCREFRIYDLACVDKSDFVVWNLDITVPTIGSVEEFAWSVRLKRPSYVVCEQGKDKCPLWIFGMIPNEDIFDSLEEFVTEIELIDSGKKILDSRWKLFDYSLR